MKETQDVELQNHSKKSPTGMSCWYLGSMDYFTPVITSPVNRKKNNLLTSYDHFYGHLSNR